MVRRFLLCLLPLALGACGGSSSSSASSPATYSINVTVSGLASGTTVTLQDNGVDTLSASNGSVAFATRIASGGGYSVAVSAQPDGQHCTISNGSGNVAGSNITISVTCAALPAAVWDSQAATWDNTAWQ